MMQAGLSMAWQRFDCTGGNHHNQTSVVANLHVHANSSRTASHLATPSMLSASAQTGMLAICSGADLIVSDLAIRTEAEQYRFQGLTILMGTAMIETLRSKLGIILSIVTILWTLIISTAMFA
jgi:hypothetical protein